MTGRYAVEWIGRKNRHTMILDGPDARSRAMRYARERGPSATVTEMETGRLIWRFHEEREHQWQQE